MAILPEARTRSWRRRPRWTHGVVLGLILAGIGTHVWWERRELRHVRIEADLPPLPANAAGVQIDASHGVFSDTHHLRFHAPCEEIDDFVARSPRLAPPSSAEPYAWWLNRNGPRWFQPPRDGESYEIHWREYSGVLVVDRRSCTVFVKVSYS